MGGAEWILKLGSLDIDGLITGQGQLTPQTGSSQENYPGTRNKERVQETTQTMVLGSVIEFWVLSLAQVWGGLSLHEEPNGSPGVVGHRELEIHRNGVG